VLLVPFRSAADEVIRLEVAGAEEEPSTLASGEADRAMPLPFPLPALRNGEGVRPTTGGVAVREMGGVGRLIAGLSHDEKKSSGSPEGVEVPSVGPLLITSVICTFPSSLLS